MLCTQQYLCMLALGVALLMPRASQAGPHHQRVPVPPTDEIEILDPNASPTGKPAVLLEPDENGGLKVDIPPVVLVHKFYYTGDRTFQAQILPGGPSVAVLNHPKTGERCYIPLTMLPGAPRVTYSGHGVDYDYGTQGVAIVFKPFCKPKVVYRNAVPLTRKTGTVVKAVGREAKNVVECTGVPAGAHVVLKGTKNATIAIGNGVHDITKQAAAPFIAIVKMTPVGSLLQADPAREAERARDKAAHRLEQEKVILDADISTLR